MTTSPLSHRSAAFHSVMEHIVKDVPHSNAHIHNLKSRLEPLGSTVSALVAMHGNPDPTRTKAYNDKKLIETAGKLDDRRKQVFREINGAFMEGLADIKKRIDQKVRLVPDEFAAEIRAAVRTMTPAEKVRTLAELAANNNGPALAAITESPSILTGVTKDIQDRYRDNIYDIHAREERLEQAALTDALKGAVSATNVAASLASDLANPGRLAEIERGVAAAAEAETAFNNTVAA